MPLGISLDHSHDGSVRRAILNDVEIVTKSTAIDLLTDVDRACDELIIERIASEFPEDSILFIVSSMLREEMTELNEEIKDAAGEITNMISGQARKELEEIGRIFHGAIPTVVLGENHKIESKTQGTKIAIPFKTEAGNFTIEVCLEV